MGSLTVNDQLSIGIKDESFGVVNAHLANGFSRQGIDNNYKIKDEGSLSKSSFRHNGAPNAEYQTHRDSSHRDSISIARALGSVSWEDEEMLDIVCVGFGPASLAIAIALVDAWSKSSHSLPKVLLLDKEEEFSWHSGMQLPSAKMQISFLKDLATPRDPTSPFTFINYLHTKGRLNQFINLGTFLPTRLEYEDYMRWCADHFKGAVNYGANVIGIKPTIQEPAEQKVRGFTVKWKGKSSTETYSVSARHVIVAVGGEPYIPEVFQPVIVLPRHRVEHSSQYFKTVKVLEDLYRRPMFLRRQREAKEKELCKIKLEMEDEQLIFKGQYSQTEPVSLVWTKTRHAQRKEQEMRIAHLECRIAEVRAEEIKHDSWLTSSGCGNRDPRFVVVGNGQSAAEIFNDLMTRFPNSEVLMVIKGSAMRPSDDSPFVNEIFDPERVDDIYNQLPEEREKALALDKGTNYGVVRLELLEHIYEQLYMQRIHEPDSMRWRCRIITNRKISSVDTSPDKLSLLLRLSSLRGTDDKDYEEVACNHVFVATGYTRNAYQEMLKGTRSLLPDGHHDDPFKVRRDYGVQFDEEKVDKSAGIWLQGCNESTHGLSDTLLSILAVRGGEIVDSIFGDDLTTSNN